MKAVIRAVLGAIGLAPAAHVALLHAEHERAKTEKTESDKRLAELRTAAHKWKHRYEDTADAAAGWKQAAAGAKAEAGRARAEIGRLKATLNREHTKTEEWKRRGEQLFGEAKELKQRLHTTQGELKEALRAVTFAREHLMAMEVKLDLIEAAILILDSRTRDEAVARPPGALHS